MGKLLLDKSISKNSMGDSFMQKENSDCVMQWVSQFIDKLSKDHIVVERSAEKAVEKLFIYAMDNGDISAGVEAEEYIKDIVLKMEFQLMLKGLGNENTVTDADVNQLMKDLFGEEIEDQSLIKEKKKLNVVASVKETVAVEKNESVVVSSSETAIKQNETVNTDILKSTAMKENTSVTQRKENIVKGMLSGSRSNLTVLDALKISGRCPTKKDEHKNVVLDMFVIDKATRGIPKGESVLFAYYTDVAYCRVEKVKPTKNMTLKLPFMNNISRILVITENYFVLSAYFTTEKEAIVIPRSSVAVIKHVFEKKFCSVGQTQIMLNDGNIIVITIDKVIGGDSDKKQFDDFKMKIDTLISAKHNTSDAISKESGEKKDDKDFENSILKQKKACEQLKGMIFEIEKYPNPNITVIDRFVAGVLLDRLIEIFDDYLVSEEKNPHIIIFYKSCIGKKLNELLQDDLFGITNIDDWNSSGNLPEEWFSALKSVEADYNKFLDKLMADTKTKYMKLLKNQ